MPRATVKFRADANGSDGLLNFFLSPGAVTAVLDAIHDGVAIVTRDSTFVYVNPAYTRVLGETPESVIGKRLSVIEPTACILEVLRTGKAIVQEKVLIKRVGIQVVVNNTPICSPQGTMIGAISVIRNISEVVQLSEALRRMRSYAQYLQDEMKILEQIRPEFSELIGQTPIFQEALALLARVSPTEATVIILGESGVGKELAAKAIHRASKRCEGPFVRINCAAIPENLLESELFGYEDGAFTGASKRGKPGKFELAHGGTLFLDEVGDMSLGMQAKILRALQEKEIERVGGRGPIKCDVRVIAATNRDLEQMVKTGAFREDLYYRLNVVCIKLPPLRERPGDLILLINHFLSRLSHQYKKSLTCTDEALELLTLYSWPGNVRELSNVLENATLMSVDGSIRADDLPAYMSSYMKTNGVRTPTGQNKEDLNLSRLVAEVEKQTIIRAIERTRNNRSEAIRLLGISRAAFYDKLKAYRIG